MKKKNLILLGVCLAICGVSILGTYAWLTTDTKPIINNFTSTNESGLSIVLKEENFDKAKASSYLPGDVIKKDPTIENTSVKESVYAAIKVTYQDVDNKQISNIKKNDFDKYAKISDFGEGWDWVATDTSGAELYIYTKEVKATETISPALFQSVNVNKHIELKANGTLPTFNIKVEGFATQYRNVSLLDAKATLISLANMTK